tara:strand:+ start:1640 stop:2326 length:687 start_codon:yes stop_codon:yes gene_type:complete
MVLAVKKLPYRVVEVTPGIGQVAVFRLSGQRQVPILVHGNNVITDSSSIVRYLEKMNPEPTLMPKDLQEAAMVTILEDWADTTMANTSKKLLLKSLSKKPELLNALVENEIPQSIKNCILNIPITIVNELSVLMDQGEESELLNSLTQLTKSLESNNWLVGNSMSFADIAFAAQLSLLKFPASAGTKLSGKGCPGFNDHPSLQTLFEWRDELEKTLMEVDPLKITKSI